ncbi:transketolase C-terminal domain-containing protein [Geochorda subterranea]|uniref:Transketolase C-terminal domain-containing protein n=1 Tax=Geochorda subterranea TaxID=3109564 RepID=A0ABZ1BP56_9FIRM|nr:transketolase C-terminal domain-containing protein [Limnochorda sp. LNt]WRP14619.1 transketolase C-terminal domain-containing protein [Limnochorda sp. LNt]
MATTEAYRITERRRVTMTGAEATAEAMRQIHPDVVAAYPITPQTDIVMRFARFVADGVVQTEFVPVESEHSALSAVVGASAAGARAMTATSGPGFALMHEILYVAAGYRLPIVMPVANRALSGPINIHGDHSDTMGSRDAGWIHLYAENAQEAYDDLIQAVRIAEHPEVRVPVLVGQDGFIITHGMEIVEVLTDDEVRAFVGEYRPERYLLDVDHPMTVGALALQNSYFEVKRQLAEAVRRSARIIADVGEEFGRLTGRYYGLTEPYRMEDAELVIVAIGSTAGTAKDVIDELRGRGVKAGLVKVRVFRPFPARNLRDLLGRARAVAVLDRADSYAGLGGPLFAETKAALYGLPQAPVMTGYVYGLGGRDITPEMIAAVYDDLGQLAERARADHAAVAAEAALSVRYLGVRER